MRGTAEALYRFFSSFGLPAFVENNVPDEMPVNGSLVKVEPPYITYELREPEPGERSSLTARVWYIDTGFEAISEKLDEMKARLVGGASVKTTTGSVWLWPDIPFIQFQPADEPKLKIAYLLLIVGAYNL